MKLTHLGNQYTASTTTLETIETDTELCFRGRPFKMRVPSVPSVRATSQKLTYRGVSYTA